MDEKAGVEQPVEEQPVTVRFRPMQAPSLPLVLALAAVVALFVLVVAAWSALVSIAFAFAAALITMPAVDWLERRGIPRPLGALLVVLVFVATVVAVVLVSVGILVDQGAPFVASLPATLNEISSWYASLELPAELRSLLDSAFGAIGEALESLDLGSFALGVLEGLIGAVDLVVAMTVVPFFMYYVLVDQPSVSSRLQRRIPAPWQAHFNKVVEIFTTDFAEYFRAELLVGTIVGIAVALGMIVIGAIVGGPIGQYALLLGLIAAFLELLPSIGPVLSYVPALLLAVGTSPEAVVLVSIFYFILFNIESSILVPAIQGKVVAFDRASVLVLLAIGFGVGGILGAILALPLAAVARDLFIYFFQVAERESSVAAEAEPSLR